MRPRSPKPTTSPPSALPPTRSPRQIHFARLRRQFRRGLWPYRRFHKSLKPTELAGKRIAVPGLKTSAYLTLKLYELNFEPVVMPFDKIIDAVQKEVVEAASHS